MITAPSLTSCFVSLLCTIMLALIYGLPAAAVFTLGEATNGGWRLVVVVLAPLLYAVLFATTAGVLSLPFHRFIVRGKFPRDLRHPVYRGRRFYGTCWTAVFYCKPVYYLCLTLPWLKWLLFRLFGYKGQMDFTVYPDTWIRDLPLLDFGRRVYVANRATLGTNMPLINGRILVDAIHIGEGSLIGHLTMLAAGVTIGKGSEIGPGSAIGIRASFGDNCNVPSTSWINHKATVGNNSRIGACCYIGLGAKIPDHTIIPPFSSVADKTIAGSDSASETLDQS